MAALDRREEEPVARMKSALEFLWEEAQRLNLTKVAHAIGKILVLLRKQDQTAADVAGQPDAAAKAPAEVVGAKPASGTKTAEPDA